MRHRRRGRKLGRNPNHQRALMRNLASALILTERDAEGEDNPPKVKGRIILDRTALDRWIAKAPGVSVRAALRDW